MKPQTQHKTIVIGCEKLTDLAVILNGIDAIVMDGFSVVTTSRKEDLFAAVGQNKPELVVVAFADNQLIINRLWGQFPAYQFSLFCFSLAVRKSVVQWTGERTVFTYPLECARKERSIGKRIYSIARLFKKTTKPNVNSTQQTGQMSKCLLELDQKKP